MTEPKELSTNSFINTVFYDLQKTAKYTELIGKQVCEKFCKLRGPELGALGILIENPGICQRDLAKILLKDRAGTGRILDSLESKGFIIRNIDTKNNRLVRKMEVTDAGHEIFQESTQKIIDLYKIVTDKVTQKEIDNIRAGLKKLRDGLSELVEIEI